MSTHPPSVRALFARAETWREASFIAQVLRAETVGGLLLLGRGGGRAGLGELALGRRLHRHP